MPDNKVDGHNKAEIGNTKTNKYQENDKRRNDEKKDKIEY